MRKIREVLRLKFEAGLSESAIARSIGSARSTVQTCLRRAKAAGLGWPVPAEFDDEQLYTRLYQPVVVHTAVPAPDFAKLQQELKRPGVTRLLLWQEYKAAHPQGWQYSVFCDRYRRWLATQDIVLRQHHVPGDKCFVDYAGQTVGVIDRATGEVREAQVFIAALGASSYTFAEATWSQTLPDWLGSHVRALEYFGGVPLAFVPDNLKSGVNKAHRYDPELNPAYQDFAEHYGLAILPARARKPRDKAKVEVAVQVVERWILARLRDRQFFSLAELNAAIRELLTQINHRPFKKREGSRLSCFNETERAALRPLPTQPYQYATWKKAKVHLDYHVEVERAYYSVPYRLIGQTVEVRLGAQTLQVFHRGKLVAAHVRAAKRGVFSTLGDHRPPAHAAVMEITHERLQERARAVGPCTVEVLSRNRATRRHPDESLRANQGIVRLARDFSPERLEAAARRALELKAYSYRAIRALILTPGTPDPGESQALCRAHENVRGEEYFQ